MSSNAQAMPANFATGMKLPEGVTIKHPAAPFTPELAERLESARKTGRYFICVSESDEKGNLSTFIYRSKDYSPDWLLRAFHSIGQQVMLPTMSGQEVSPPVKQSEK
jgi:hypothetical protein